MREELEALGFPLPGLEAIEAVFQEKII